MTTLTDEGKECALRDLISKSTASIMEYGELKEDFDAEEIAKKIIDDTLELVKKHLL